MERKRIRIIGAESARNHKKHNTMDNEDISNILDFSVARQLCECTNTEDNPKVQKDIDDKKGLEDIEDGRTRPLKKTIDDIKTKR